MDSDDDEDWYLDLIFDEEEDDNMLDAIIEGYMKEIAELPTTLFNKDGSVRKVNRTDYSRSAKRMRLYHACPWMLLISHPNVGDPASQEGKEFRQKFRVPYPVFRSIVELCLQTNDHTFNYGSYNCAGQPSIPIELKILACLRVLGNGIAFTVASELSYMSVPAIENFFRKFCRLFKQYYEKVYIKPLDGPALVRVMSEYSRLGLPGCIGSMDATFAAWESVART
jgi:hypothetical protein